MRPVNVSITQLSVDFALQESRQVIVHNSSTHPLPPLPIPFYQLAALRMNRAWGSTPPITETEVEAAVEVFNKGPAPQQEKKDS